jgi:uncharacterized membrane protein
VIFGILVILSAVVAILFLLRLRRQRAHTVERLMSIDPFPATPGGVILRRYISAISNPGVEEAQLGVLGKEFADAATEVLPALAQAWRAAPEQETGLRWALVYAAPIIGPSVVPFLREVILSPVSPEHSPDPHSYSTKAWDSIVRSRAVGGLESLAVAGAPGAESVLFDCLSHELFSIRALAAVALIHLSGDGERREQVQRALPEAERSIINIERVRVNVVPQVRDPRKHLASLLGHYVSLPPSPPDDQVTPQRVQSPREPNIRHRRTSAPTIPGGR